jgi:crotonobetainyl-CoA:carnitine CoA-transferase CaiB-like acyl-CoA transferase
MERIKPFMTETTALAGLRILDFTRVLAGPFCTMLLADLGADVIKVEQPGVGDETRTWGPPWGGDPAQRQSAYYLSVNRNKRGLSLNLKLPEGRELARQLALCSDVLIENFKVGGMAAFGLDFETLHVAHPGLVYCSITGYGQTGPYADRAGYDYVIQGQSGLMAITGEVAGEPMKVGVAVADVITGLFAANSIQAALRHRDRTGEGQYIDIALLDSQIAALVNVASNYLVSGTPPNRFGNAHPNIVPYQAFEASDGYFNLAVGNDSQFRRCCELIDASTLVTDPRFATNPARATHRDALIAALRPILMTRTVAEWVALFVAEGVPAGEINTIPAVFADPQVKARGVVQSVTLPDGTPVQMVGPTPQLSATPATIRRPPPTLGGDTDSILREWLDLDDSAITAYRRTGVI